MQTSGHIIPDLHLNLFIYTVEIVVLVYSNIYYKKTKKKVKVKWDNTWKVLGRELDVDLSFAFIIVTLPHGLQS